MSKKSIANPANIHQSRYARFKMGLKPSEIAAQDGVKEKAVLASIAMTDSYRLTNTVDAMSTGLIDTVLGRKEKLDAALDDALAAKIIGREGVSVPNHNVRLSAIREIRALAQVVQPKVIANRNLNLNVNQQQAMAAGSAVHSETQFIGFEERLRMIRGKVDDHNRLPPPESVAAPLGEGELSLEEEGAGVHPADTQG